MSEAQQEFEKLLQNYRTAILAAHQKPWDELIENEEKAKRALTAFTSRPPPLPAPAPIIALARKVVEAWDRWDTDLRTPPPAAWIRATKEIADALIAVPAPEPTAEPDMWCPNCEYLMESKAAHTQEPISMVLHCPECRLRHIDVAKFATKPHHTHACQGCGFVWRPSIAPTVGVQFLPGFKNDPDIHAILDLQVQDAVCVAPRIPNAAPSEIPSNPPAPTAKEALEPYEAGKAPPKPYGLRADPKDDWGVNWPECRSCVSRIFYAWNHCPDCGAKNPACPKTVTPVLKISTTVAGPQVEGEKRAWDAYWRSIRLLESLKERMDYLKMHGNFTTFTEQALDRVNAFLLREIQWFKIAHPPASPDSPTMQTEESGIWDIARKYAALHDKNLGTSCGCDICNEYGSLDWNKNPAQDNPTPTIRETM